MSAFNSSIGASTYQKGQAAELRTFTTGKVRNKLNQIVHSGDKRPRKGNVFIDPTNSYDPEAQDAIDEAQELVNRSREYTER
jgi:hypothetical protein